MQMKRFLFIIIALIAISIKSTAEEQIPLLQINEEPDENAEHDSSIFLGQNYPSPVTNETFVDITIPENIHKASLFIYDTKGTKIRQEDIARRGTTTMRIDTSNLSTGIYVYSLVANGKVAQTRRMIVE